MNTAFRHGCIYYCSHWQTYCLVLATHRFQMIKTKWFHFTSCGIAWPTQLQTLSVNSPQPPFSSLWTFCNYWTVLSSTPLLISMHNWTVDNGNLAVPARLDELGRAVSVQYKGINQYSADALFTYSGLSAVRTVLHPWPPSSTQGLSFPHQLSGSQYAGVAVRRQIRRRPLTTKRSEFTLWYIKNIGVYRIFSFTKCSALRPLPQRQFSTFRTRARSGVYNPWAEGLGGGGPTG